MLCEHMQEGTFDTGMVEQLKNLQGQNEVTLAQLGMSQQDVMQKILSDPELAQVCNQ